MLERVTIVPHVLDLGEIAEALIYYGHVDVVLTIGGLVSIVESVGIDQTIRLAESDLVTLHYSPWANVVQSEESAFLPHSFALMRIHATVDGRRIKTPVDEFTEVFASRFGHGAIGRVQTRRLIKALHLRDGTIAAIQQRALADVLDPGFLTPALDAVLKTIVPEYPRFPPIRAEALTSGGRISINSNVDFQLADFLCKNSSGRDATFNVAHLLSIFLNMRSEIFYSGGSGSDIWTDGAHSAALKTRVNSFIYKLDKNREVIDRFEEFVFSGRSFSDAVHSGERLISDVLDFAEEKETRRFKEWIKSGPRNGDLLVEYEKSKIRPSRLASALPTKAVKIALFSAAGVVLDKAFGGAGIGGVAGGLASGVAASVAEDFLMSHLKFGWRPNQWVTRSAAPFLRG